MKTANASGTVCVVSTRTMRWKLSIVHAPTTSIQAAERLLLGSSRTADDCKGSGGVMWGEMGWWGWCVGGWGGG